MTTPLATDDAALSDKQRRKLNSLFRQIGLKDPDSRDVRNSVLSYLVGSPVYLHGLTAGQADRAVTELQTWIDSDLVGQLLLIAKVQDTFTRRARLRAEAEATDDELHERIRDAFRGGVPAPPLMEVTGLSETMIYKIRGPRHELFPNGDTPES